MGSTELVRLVKLVERVQAGDQEALVQAREVFNQVPSLWGMISVAKTTRLALVKALVGENPLLVEGCAREADALQQQLAGANPTPLEAVLAERTATCWLAAQHVDYIAARFLDKGGTFAQGEYWRRHQDSAHRRFLAACRTLATVRRLALPVLLTQVNVLQQQQVEIAAGGEEAGADGGAMRPR